MKYSTYDYDDDLFLGFEDKESLLEERNLQNSEWKEFIESIKSNRLKDIFQEAFNFFFKEQFKDADDVLLTNYRVVMNYPEAEDFIKQQIISRAFNYIFHPLSKQLIKQIKLSSLPKPEVGALIRRDIHISWMCGGSYVAFPTHPAVNSDDVLTVKISKQPFTDEWIAVHVSYKGMICFLEEVPKKNWSHVKITHVGPRSCRGVPVYEDFDKYLKEQVVILNKRRHPTYLVGSLKVRVEWEGKKTAS